MRQEGTHVLVIQNGRAVLDLPWEAAVALSRALRVKAKDAEELAKADIVARDAALLLRAGVPIGLTSHGKIRDEAVKLAVSDRGLRRALPGGIRSREMLGRPAVHVQRKDRHAGK